MLESKHHAVLVAQHPQPRLIRWHLAENYGNDGKYVALDFLKMFQLPEVIYD